MYYAFIDIVTCGNDCYGMNNNPIFSHIRIADNIFNTKKDSITYIIPNENITSYSIAYNGITLETIMNNNHVSLVDYLERTYINLKKLNDAKVTFVGFNIRSRVLDILNKNFKNIINKEEIVWNNVLEVKDVCERMIDLDKIGTYTFESCWYSVYDKTLESKSYHNNYTVDNEIALTCRLMNLKELETIDDLVNYMNEEVEFNTFNFGKYKGLDIDKVFEIDKQYLNWILKTKTMHEGRNNLIKKINELFNKD